MSCYKYQMTSETSSSTVRPLLNNTLRSVLLVCWLVFPKSPETETVHRKSNSSTYTALYHSYHHPLPLPMAWRRLSTKIMATPPFPLVLSFLILLSLSSSANSYPPRSSKHAPRFLGKFSHLHQPTDQKYETRYFEQRLDHFSFADLPSFRQKYLINTQHWLGPSRLGPILFYCGNEGNIEWFAANTGFVWEIAPRFGAMIIFPEVRLIILLRTTL